MARLRKPRVPDGPHTDLVEQLHALYADAGEPSVREITQRAQQISRDTVHRVLTSDSIPRWGALEAVVIALGGDPEVFAALWRAARIAEEAYGAEAAAPPATRTTAATAADTDPGKAPIRIMIVDDHRLMLRAVSDVAESHGFTVVGTATNGEDAVRLALELRPDVVVMDVVMPGLSGIEATARLRAADPSIRVLMLSGYPDRQAILDSVAAGAVGFLLKDVDLDALVQGIRRAATGRPVFDPESAETVFWDHQRLTRSTAHEAPAELPQLSHRELQILKLVAQGKSNQEIAEALAVSRRTVDTYLSRIVAKLGVRGRADLIRFGVKAGLDIDST